MKAKRSVRDKVKKRGKNKEQRHKERGEKELARSLELLAAFVISLHRNVRAL